MQPPPQTIVVSASPALKRVKGGWSLFSTAAATTDAAAVPIVSMSQSLAAAAQKADLETASAAATVAAAAMVGKAGVAALASTGVGLPIAGALGVVLLVAYTMSKMVVANKKLWSILSDVLNIISNCYRIDQLVTRTINICTIAVFNKQSDIAAQLLTNNGTALVDENVFNERLAEAQAKKSMPYSVSEPKTLLQQIEPSIELRERLMSKIGSLTAYLLAIAPDKLLNDLKNDSQSSTTGIDTVVNAEYEKRKNRSMIGRRIGAVGRIMNRSMNAAELQTQIINELTIIEGFFMLMKAQYDTTMDYYAAHMDNWAETRAVIELTTEFRDYLVPLSLQEEITNAVLNQEEIKKAVNVVVEGVAATATDTTATDTATTTTVTAGGKAARRTRRGRTKPSSRSTTKAKNATVKRRRKVHSLKVNESRTNTQQHYY